MDDLLQRETERQRRLLQEARKAIEQEKERMRQGGTRRIEPTLDEPDTAVAATPAAPSPLPGAGLPPIDETARPQGSDAIRVRSIPDMRSALIPLDESDGTGWSKPFSLPRADIEPWLSYLRGYRQSCLFPYAAAADQPAGRELEVDAAVQALFELKRIDLRIILDPAVQIDGPVEYFDAATDPSAGQIHESQLAKAVEKGRKMGNYLYDALLGEGYANLAQAWEKAYGRKPSVMELHSMLTTGRVKPPAEAETGEGQALLPVREAIAPNGNSVTQEQRDGSARYAHGKFSRLIKRRASIGSFKSADRRKILFHLIHAAVVCAVIAAYFIIMRLF